MIRRRRKRVPIISDSSEDDSPRPRKSSKTQNQQPADNVFLRNSRRRQIERRENNGCSSDNSSIQTLGKRVIKVPVITIEESSSSDDELEHTARRETLRALSDYENEYGSVGISDTSPGHFNGIKYSEGSNKVDIVIPPKREVDLPATNTSGLPTVSTVVPKLITIVSSDEETDHHHIRQKNGDTSTMNNRNNIRNVGEDIVDNWAAAFYSDNPSTSRNSSPIQQQTDKCQGASISTSDINYSLKTSTFEDNFPVKYSEGHGAQVALLESHDLSTCKPKSVSSSSAQPECCPICFVHLDSQEIGTPVNCDHCFCLSCIQEWAKNKNTCPVDRKLFNSIIVRSYDSHNVIRKIPVEDVTTLTLTSVGGWGDIVILASDDDEDWVYEEDSSDDDDIVCCICSQSG